MYFIIYRVINQNLVLQRFQLSALLSLFCIPKLSIIFFNDKKRFEEYLSSFQATSLLECLSCEQISNTLKHSIKYCEMHAKQFNIFEHVEGI